MRRTASFLLLLALFGFTCYGLDEPSVSAESAVLMVAETGELVYAKNEHERRGMASTTKIMTALLTLECATPQKQVTVTEQMAAVEGTSMGLLAGDKVTYHDLVYGMLLASGNDAANTAAISIAGSIPAFARLMNERAVQIGMTNTSFVTPSGLDDENHYSTAYDMALLGCEAIKNPDFLMACSSVQAKLCYGNEPYTRYLSNHNKLLKTFDGALGIKTGFTKKSGRCLVSAAERNGVSLICVTLNAPDDYRDHATLYDRGFEMMEKYVIPLSDKEIDVVGGEKDTLRLRADCSVPIGIKKSEVPDITEEVNISHFLYAPVTEGAYAGYVDYYCNGTHIGRSELFTSEGTEIKKTENKGVVEKISDFIKDIFS